MTVGIITRFTHLKAHLKAQPPALAVILAHLDGICNSFSKTGQNFSLTILYNYHVKIVQFARLAFVALLHQGAVCKPPLFGIKL